MVKKQAIILHQIIRGCIYANDYITTIKMLKKQLYDNLNFSRLCVKLSLKKIKKIVDYVYLLDKQNELVSSCISITILAHILCEMANIKSQIVIGVNIENGKLLSHSWLVLKNNEVINYFTDYKKYRPIKKFMIKEV